MVKNGENDDQRAPEELATEGVSDGSEGGMSADAATPAGGDAERLLQRLERTRGLPRTPPLQPVEQLGTSAKQRAREKYLADLDHSDPKVRALKSGSGPRRWRQVMEQAEQGRHVSCDQLILLIREHGVPPWAGGYVADRLSGKIAPAHRPYDPPLDRADRLTWFSHFEGEKPYPFTRPRGWLGQQPRQFWAVQLVGRRHYRYATMEFRNPSPRNLARMRYVKARNVWKVKNPKAEARRRVARRWECSAKRQGLDKWHMSPETLERWEAAIRKLLG